MERFNPKLGGTGAQLGLITSGQKVKGLISAPTIRVKIAVERQNRSCVVLIGEGDEAGVSEIHPPVAILAQHGLNRRSLLRELKRDVKNAFRDIPQDGFSRAGHPS